MACEGGNGASESDETGTEVDEDHHNETFGQSPSSKFNGPSTSGHSSGKVSRTTLLSFFKRTRPDSDEDIPENIPTKKKKSLKVESPQLICLKCGLKFKRTNKYYLERHGKEKHKYDTGYNASKDIVHIDSPMNTRPFKHDTKRKNHLGTKSTHQNGDKPPSDCEKPPSDCDKPPSDCDKPPSDCDKPPSDCDKPPSDCDKPLPSVPAHQPSPAAAPSPSPTILTFEDGAMTDVMEMPSSLDTARPISPTPSSGEIMPRLRAAQPVTLEDYVLKKKNTEAPTTNTLAEILTTLRNLEAKIDQISMQHPSKKLETSSYLMDAATTQRFHEATSIAAVAACTSIVLEPLEMGEETRIYCSLCREAFGLEGPSKHGKKMLSSIKFCEGFLEKNENLVAANGLNKTKNPKRFSELKKEIGSHLTGMSTSGHAHLDAHKLKKREMETEEKHVDALQNLVKAALTTIKMGAAAEHFETEVVMLDDAKVDVGTLGHSRKQMEGFTDALIGHCRLKLKRYLTTPLPSTSFFPHYAVACDKSTPGRETNHAIMLLAPYKGVRQAYPIGAPKVYSNEEGRVVGGTAEELAAQVIDTIVEFSLVEPENLSYLIANHSDGQYQSVGFQAELSKHCQTSTREGRAQGLEFPVIWDGAHWLDLCIKTTKDKSSSSKFFKKFLDRANSFNDMFHSGRGYDEYKAVKEKTNAQGVRLSGYSVTRFSSSAFDSLKGLYSSYKALILTYEENRETESDTDEMKFKIRGWDFALELCLMLDIFQPIVSVMVLSQRVGQQIWSITAWIEDLIQLLKTMENDLRKLKRKEDLRLLPIARFPITTAHTKELLSSTKENKHGTFHSMPLVEGWLVVDKEEGSKNGIDWKMLEFKEIAKELCTLTTNLIANIEIRHKSGINGMASTLAACIAPIPIIKRLCGSRSGPTKRPIMGGGGQQQNRFKTDGREAFRAFYAYVCELPHISSRQKKDGLLFDEDMADEVFSKYTDLLYDMVWNTNSLRRKVFTDLPTTTARLVEFSFHEHDQTTLQAPIFRFRFSDRSETKSAFDEGAFISAIYTEEEVYTELGIEAATALDVAVAMGGCEAIVEGFYSVIKRHLFQGPMENKNMVERAIVDWLMPIPARCPSTIKSVAKLYLKGHSKLNLLPHRSVHHSDVRNRGKYSDVSKVIKRHTQKPVNYPLFLDQEDLTDFV
ncbi:uncharacterized protein LOC108674085 [Hyalella azteca]|uniref:Uncharacterized protein LOC108674085 n=1 Tax=Hyalella azteca TaxID=294128 RepID=A0A8B7NUR8_HYAAZ|nr:uncharacterized protein LOC108674085 [Hyalella azteca]